jgi:RHS repeat-associated protein
MSNTTLQWTEAFIPAAFREFSIFIGLGCFCVSKRQGEKSVRYLLQIFILVLPSLALAQAQCTFYQARRTELGYGPGPVEIALSAAESDADTILQQEVQGDLNSSHATLDSDSFDGCRDDVVGVSLVCSVTYSFHNPWQSWPPGPRYENISITKGACPQQKYWATSPPPPKGNVCTRNCVGDPINPGPGNVYKREDDDVRVSGPSPIRFQRFYNSADAIGSDMGPGWRHTYSRSISVNYGDGASVPYLGASSSSSAQYSNPASACTSGFLDVKGSNSSWTDVLATYSDNVCVLSSGGVTVGTLIIASLFPDPPLSAPTEYDVVRDDGKTYRYTTQGGSINTPPGVSLRFAVTSSGFSLTDDQDNVEIYNSAGVLQSITSRSGLVQTLFYDANGLLVSVTDSFGNSLAISRYNSMQIAGVSVNGGSSVQFSYGPTFRLIKVTNSDSTTRVYQYLNSLFADALTGEVDESGVTYATWTYDSQERAISSSLAGGANAVSLVYNDASSTTVTDALGAVRTFSFGRSGDQMPVTGITGAPCPNCADAAATTYDSAGWVSSRTDYNGNVTCYVNDQARGLELIRVEGFASGSTCPTDLYSYTPPSGTTQRKITTTWHQSFTLPTSITEATRTTSFDYDASGNLLRKMVTDTTASPNVSRIWTYTYNGYGQVLTSKGPRTDLDSTISNTYYSCTSGAQCGQVQTVTDALGHVWTYNTYNAYGQPLTITDPNGIVTTLTYNTRQRLTSRSTAGETTSFSYYPTGLLQTVTLPDNSTLTYTYDGAHRLTQISDGLGNKIVYTLDAMGNRTAETTYDPTGTLHRTHSRAFNTLSELYQDVNAANTSAVTTTYGYDSNGNETSVAAPLGRRTAQLYDALDRLTQISDPTDGVTQMAYDTNDNLVSTTDPRSLSTFYSYNGFGDLVSQLSPDTGSTSNTYDSAGNLVTSTDARGAMATYVYDALNRVTSASYSLSGITEQSLAFTYDSGSNGKEHLTGASDANHFLGWSYDALGRVIGKSQTVDGVTKAVGYGYTSGDLTTLTTPSGQTVTYGYNSNHQIISIAVNGITVLNGVTYEPLGPVNGWTWGNATSMNRTFNGDGLVSEINDTPATPPQSCPVGQSLMWSDTSSYDGNPDLFFSTPQAAAQSAMARSNAYNHCNCAALASLTQSSWNFYIGVYTWNGGNPTRFSVPGSCMGTISTITALNYTFDDANRVTAFTNASSSDQSWSYAYDSLDRLTSASTAAESHGWTYDSNGNRLSETGTSPSAYSISTTSNQITGITGTLARTYTYDAAGHTTSYATMSATYNDAGRLKTVTQGSFTETLVYNALGQRIETSGGAAGTVLYWYDEEGHLLGEYDGSGNLIEETVWLGDIPVATLRPSASSVAIYYVFTDRLNTPREVIRPADNVPMWTWFSDPFGTEAPNSNPAGAGTFAYNLRLPGQVFDGQVGLHYNYLRDYDPGTGRYIESDPAGLWGGVGTYTYVGGAPLTFVDPLGLAPGDPYHTQDEAGVAAACDFNAISVLKNLEYSGFVYQNPDGSYSYTWGYSGDNESSGPSQALANYPQIPVAWYHTHGAYDYKYGAGNFQYSPEDRGFSDATDKPNYLADPWNNVHRYDPDPLQRRRGHVHNFGQCGCSK